MKKAIIGLYRHDPRAADGAGASRIVKRIELDVPFDELTRGKKWKQLIEEKAREEGFDVLSVNVVHSQADLDVNIIVTVDKKPTAFGEKRKPKTRGGRPVEGPVKTGKTMAAKRRAAREAPRR